LMSGLTAPFRGVSAVNVRVAWGSKARNKKHSLPKTQSPMRAPPVKSQS
jgi:hypothetical protein